MADDFTQRCANPGRQDIQAAYILLVTETCSKLYIIEYTVVLLYLYRARNKITQLSIPTHAQLQRHRLKFIKII